MIRLKTRNMSFYTMESGHMSELPVNTLLEDFGLSSAEAEVLSILLQSPTTSLTGNAVARNTSITRYYVFSLLSRLVQKGFAAEIKERPRPFRTG